MLPTEWLEMEGGKEMKQLTYKCNLSKEKRPEWVRRIISVIHTLMAQRMTGDASDFTAVHADLCRLIYQMTLAGDLKSKVTAELVTDEGETVLFIKRSGRILISIYIK